MRPHRDSKLIILKIGPKESPSGSGYTTQVRRCAMPNAVDETSAVTATVLATRFQPDPPRAIISEEPERAWNAPEQPACDSEQRCDETQTELASASRVAILGQLSASIAEINQPICAVVMGAEAA